MTGAAPSTIALPAGAAAAVRELLLAMADDEAVIGWTDSEWTGIAPILEEDVAMSSLAQDELGHAHALYALLADLPGEHRDADGIAYDRDPAAYRHARLMDHPRGDWAMTIARRYLYETSDAVRLEALAGGAWAPLADLVGKMQREERYHRMHVGTWFERLARDGGVARQRLAAALAALAPDAATVFTPLPGEPALLAAGILAAGTADQEAIWRRRVEPDLLAHELPVPPPLRDPEGGRTQHGAAFAWLHGQMTMVRSGDPGATW
jgi:ring-1,2-phenylacetyl-CoA epoxidase subunit PaaC